MIYADWRESSAGEITEALEHRLIFRLTGTPGGKLVLDAGCGDRTPARTRLVGREDLANRQIPDSEKSLWE